MILTCPNCQTQFSLSATALGAKGRKVKCSRCSHSWFQKPEEQPEVVALKAEAANDTDAAIAAVSDILDAGGGAPEAESSATETPSATDAILEQAEAVRPVVKPAAASAPPAPVMAGPWLKIATVAVWCLVLITGIFAAVPLLGHAKLAYGLGLQPTHSFALEGMGMAVHPAKDKKLGLVFNGDVRSSAGETLPAPVVSITLYDHLDREMRTLDYSFPVANIEAGKTLAFDPKINNIPDSLSRVVLELGNAVEQKLR